MQIVEGIVSISVRDLIEFVLRRGSIDSHVVSANRAVLGTLAHQKLQKSMPPTYESEVSLKHTHTLGDLVFIVEGRADGIITTLTEVTVDEIKSTTMPLEQIDHNYNPLHWAQVKCYAYMLAYEKQLSSVQVQLTYVQLDTEKVKRLTETFSFLELKEFFEELLVSYEAWIRFYMEWTKKRDLSLQSLQFPFDAYRSGQREVAVGVYKSILANQKLYVSAPTGIGKTISTLFPALKAMGEGHVAKIFYLTAKTITRTVAENTLRLLYEQKISIIKDTVQDKKENATEVKTESEMESETGAIQVKSVTLTAKDKICFLEKRNCTPSACPYADGHFDRINTALLDALSHCDFFTREVIEMYAKKHRVCPFEFSLDLCTWSDVIIGDYNYVFDPTASLKRFSNSAEFVFLIDEAHNLVDRAREMFSATISKNTFLKVKKNVAKTHPSISRALGKLNSYLVDVRHTYLEEGSLITKDAPKEVYSLLRKWLKECDKSLQNPISPTFPEDLLTLYFDAYQFVKLFELYDEHYVTYATIEEKDLLLKLFCLDPSFLISEILATCKSAIFFSATLLPMDYYRKLLGGEEAAFLTVPSPFNTKNSLRMIATDISTKFVDRMGSYPQIGEYIHLSTVDKIGNYMIFFPSYQYMEATYDTFSIQLKEQPKENRPILHLQKRTMTEEDREAFLLEFSNNPTESHIGFCVLGGMFSEGIDLTGDRLIGVIVVSVGIPQIGLERNLIKEYFDTINNNGYLYAYTYPGMNKVLQAIGRLIRTTSDRGFILLLDNRFHTPLYESILPAEFFPYHLIRQKELPSLLNTFWSSEEKL